MSDSQQQLAEPHLPAPEPVRWWRRKRVVAFFVLVQPINYVLGLGPAAKLHPNVSAPVQAVIEFIYAPVVWWDQEDLPGSDLLNEYVQWWEMD